MRVVVAGGTGFIGRLLVSRLVSKGHEVLVLTRSAKRPKDLDAKAAFVSWADGSEWESGLDGADSVINLAGEPVAQRWTEAAKKRILDSRVEATSRLFAAIEKANRRPDVVVNASAVGYYGPRGDEELTEEAAPGSDFLARTCVAWEDAAKRFETLGARVARVRIGVVLSREGGALAKMIPPFRAFAGGPLGTGTQWLSWIHRDDLVELLLFALKTPSASGALNGTSPNPVTMRTFATTLGKTLRRPSFLPTPAAAIRLALGEMSTVVLDGQRVVPARAKELGFVHRFPELGKALGDATQH